MTLLAVPEHFTMLDLTVHMDIHPQPGPVLTSEDSGKRDTMLRKNCRGRSGRSSLFKTIERETLLSLRRYAYKPCASVIGDLKALGILKYRGRRGGKRAKHNQRLLKDILRASKLWRVVVPLKPINNDLNTGT